MHQLQRALGNAALSRVARELPLGGGGEPLDPNLRRSLEPHLGLRLDAVRVHHDATAAASARALHARAYAAGRDVVFAPGEFRPATRAGRRLLVHELVHVAQQAGHGVVAIQRQRQEHDPAWHRQLDDILPRHVGLLVHIMRTQQLLERFSEDQLRELVALIHPSADALRLTHEYGVPGVFALQDTRVGNRLDVAAARLLLTRFPARRRAPRASQESRREVFSEDVVRDAYLRFHYNALLPRDEAHFAPDLPPRTRRDCISIVHDMMPRLFTDPRVVRRVRGRLGALRGQTLTMVHTGRELEAAGVAHAPIVIRFKDANGRTTNGNTEPTEADGHVWDSIMRAVGGVYGWHIFGMAVMDGHHSVTLFVDNQPDGPTLYWADQWHIDPGEDFRQAPGAVSGFRQYDQAGFDRWINELTNLMWREVHNQTSPCARRHPRTWDTSCRYNATLRIWHLRRAPQPRSHGG